MTKLNDLIEILNIERFESTVKIEFRYLGLHLAEGIFRKIDFYLLSLDGDNMTDGVFNDFDAELYAWQEPLKSIVISKEVI